MSKQDDRLEEKIKVMEEGVEPETVMGGSSNSSELKSLVSLAASIRDLPHPELDQQTIQSDKRRLISAAREKNRASRNSRATKSNGFTGLWLFVPAVAGVALILLMAFVLSAGAGLYFSGPRGAQTAILTDAAGVLEVSDTGVAGDWRLVTNGDKVRTGQRLRTGDESWVTLEFFDGTRTTLSPNTDLMLNKIDGNWGNELQVELIQNVGETNHEVIPLQGDQSIYQVLTPSGEASVRGTSFNVLVEDTGMSLFTVETGEVLVSNDGSKTYLAAGQGVITELGKPLPSPLYSFNLLGDLDKIEGKIWYVEGVPITVKGGTKITGDPQKEKPVFVMGHTTKKHEWIADYIRALEEGDKGGSFTGVVTSAIGDGLAINGYDFIVDENQPDVAVGDLVRVTFEITEQGWVVLSLVPLDGGDDDDDDPDVELKLFFNPDEKKIPTCEFGPDLPSTTLNYETDDDQALPLDVLLSVVIIEGEDEGLVTGVSLYLDPTGDALDLNEPISIPRMTPVNIFFEPVLAAGVVNLEPGDEIKIQVMAKGTLDGEDLTDVFQIKWECEEDDPESELKFNPDEKEITACEVGSEAVPDFFETSLKFKSDDENVESLEVFLEPMIVKGKEEGLVVDVLLYLDTEQAPLNLDEPILIPRNGSVELFIQVVLADGVEILEPGDEIEIQVLAKGTLDGEDLTDDFNIVWDCEEDDPDDDEVKEGHYCTTDDRHPHAETLAEEYAELLLDPYNDIMKWFCEDNLGFGEIELGFKLYLKYEDDLPFGEIADVYDIIDLRLSGMGWGQVKHEMASLAKEALSADEPAAKKEPPGKEKSEEAKNKEKPNKKDKGDD